MQTTTRLNTPVSGILLMIGGLALLTLNDAVAKWLSPRYPVGEIIALRSLFIVITLGIGLGGRGGLKALKPTRYWNQFLRGLCFLVSSFAIVTALSLMPIADATAITFASPLFIVALAGPLLGERVGLNRWVAAIIGFVGVLIIAKPTPNAFQWGALAALAAAVGSTARDMVTRHISAVESSNVTTFYSMVMGTAAGLLTAWVSPWSWPTGSDFWLFILLGVLNGGAHLMMIESYRRAEAS
ncbi:DMT family transporter, partial [Candidatus Entotheonella palauensis]